MASLLYFTESRIQHGFKRLALFIYKRVNPETRIIAKLILF